MKDYISEIVTGSTIRVSIIGGVLMQSELIRRDPFQDAVPCFQQQPTCYCPQGWHLNRWRHASLDYCKGYLRG